MTQQCHLEAEPSLVCSAFCQSPHQLATLDYKMAAAITEADYFLAHDQQERVLFSCF